MSYKYIDDSCYLVSLLYASVPSGIDHPTKSLFLLSPFIEEETIEKGVQVTCSSLHLPF